MTAPTGGYPNWIDPASGDHCYARTGSSPLGQSPPDALKARARESLSLWDRTTGVVIEVYTGMVAAETAYREAPELVADLLARIEELEAEREQ